MRVERGICDSGGRGGLLPPHHQDQHHPLRAAAHRLRLPLSGAGSATTYLKKIILQRLAEISVKFLKIQLKVVKNVRYKFLFSFPCFELFFYKQPRSCYFICIVFIQWDLPPLRPHCEESPGQDSKLGLEEETFYLVFKINFFHKVRI